MKSIPEGQLSPSAQKSSAKVTDPCAIGPSAVSDFGENCRLGNSSCINHHQEIWVRQLWNTAMKWKLWNIRAIFCSIFTYESIFNHHLLTPSSACILNNLLGKALTVNSSVPGERTKSKLVTFWWHTWIHDDLTPISPKKNSDAEHCNLTPGRASDPWLRLMVALGLKTARFGRPPINKIPLSTKNGTRGRLLCAAHGRNISLLKCNIFLFPHLPCPPTQPGTGKHGTAVPTRQTLKY